jgi:hypothetical protein
MQYWGDGDISLPPGFDYGIAIPGLSKMLHYLLMFGVLSVSSRIRGTIRVMGSIRSTYINKTIDQTFLGPSMQTLNSHS